MKRYNLNLKNKNVSLKEGEASASISDADTKLLIRQVEAIENESKKSREEFINNLKKRYKIENVGGISKCMRALCMGVAGLGIIGNILGFIGSAVVAGLHVAAGRGGMGLVSLTGACISAFLVFAYYKIYKVLEKTSVSESAYSKKYQKLAIQKIVLESTVAFCKISRVAKGENFTEGESNKSAIGVIARALKMCKEMFAKIKSGTAKWVKKHPAFTAAILICIGLITAYLVGSAKTAQAKPITVAHKPGIMKQPSVDFNAPELSNNPLKSVGGLSFGTTE